MTTERQRTGSRLAGPNNRPDVKKMSARQFPVQREIQKLEEELNAFNECIAELEGERHHGHAMEVLKVNAMDFARRIDELRSLLIGLFLKPHRKNYPMIFERKITDNDALRTNLPMIEARLNIRNRNG